MMMGSDSPAVAGGLARHIPVLAGRAMAWLSLRAGGLYIDATFGAGGIRARHPGDAGHAGDRNRSGRAGDRGSCGLVEQSQGRLTLAEGCFSDLESIAAHQGFAAVDGVVFDLGVSSMQLDAAARGFSFRFDGPLDMRMGGTAPARPMWLRVPTSGSLPP